MGNLLNRKDTFSLINLVDTRPLGLVCPLGQSAAYIINREQVPHFIPTQFCFMCLEGGKLQSIIKVYNDVSVGVIEPQWTRFGDMRQSVIL